MGLVGSKEEVAWVCCMSLGEILLPDSLCRVLGSHWWNILWISSVLPHPALSNLRGSPGIRVWSMANNSWVFIHRWLRSGRCIVWPSGEGGWWFYITARVHSEQEADRESGGPDLLCLQLASVRTTREEDGVTLIFSKGVSPKNFPVDPPLKDVITSQKCSFGEYILWV